MKLPRDPNCNVCGGGTKTHTSELLLEIDDPETEAELKSLIKRILEQE